MAEHFARAAVGIQDLSGLAVLEEYGIVERIDDSLESFFIFVERQFRRLEFGDIPDNGDDADPGILLKRLPAYHVPHRTAIIRVGAAKLGQEPSARRARLLDDSRHSLAILPAHQR